ncbi:phytoene/squalene synthase family protein [Kitasatospora camelliae]|uniref:Squalene/phytoene synthase family protein n=1 Tax=Kitasatospora camelliae TaxID=3156397 RepID=A0AAU8JVT1_9ACTN
MGWWERALDAAGVADPVLRADFGRQREEVTAYRREAAMATGLLLPGRMVPPVMAATAFMHRTDSLLDSGPADRGAREEAFRRWRGQVLDGLAAGRSEAPELRPLLHTVAAHPVLRDRIPEYLDAAAVELDFTGFATEADYQRYVDAYSLPGFMAVAALLGPRGDQTAYRAACRTYIDAAQRLDFVNDLAEDLGEGRLALPAEALARHGVERADLEAGRDLPGVRGLLGEALDLAEVTLAEGAAVVELVPEANRPMVRGLIGLDRLTLAAARRDPAALLRRSARPSVPGALRLLAGEYRRARRLRRR